MTIAERMPNTWFDRLTMTDHLVIESYRPELIEGCRNVCANNYAVMYKEYYFVLLQGQG